MKTHLDLFSGIGGFAIAAQACGYTTIGFCEKEPYAQQILKERFGAVLADADSGRSEQRDAQERRLSKPHAGNPRIHPDIFTLNGADYAGVDLLTGGFPCQPFSVAGKRKGAADDRALWPEMLRVIDGAKPAWIIGENVAGIVTMELDNILSSLEGIGYTSWPLVIPACAVDARHRRDRVWIVAHAIGLRESQSSGSIADERGRVGNQGEDVADADDSFSQGNECTQRGEPERAEANQCCEWRDEGEWFTESGMGRVAHGIPNRAHRLRGLGNAIVPQVAYEIIMAIPPRKIALATGAGLR
jgi:DNA (cytosine-5)-methyltransferase 1